MMPNPVQRLEVHLANRVNAERESAGLQRLTYDRQLAEVARAHSVEMRDLNYFAHESPTPHLRTIKDRYQLGFGQQPRLVSENIFHYPGVNIPPPSLKEWLMSGPIDLSFSPRATRRPLDVYLADLAHAELMNSPGHYKNILRSESTHMGMGFAIDDKHGLWVTQMFSCP